MTFSGRPRPPSRAYVRVLQDTGVWNTTVAPSFGAAPLRTSRLVAAFSCANPTNLAVSVSQSGWLWSLLATSYNRNERVELWWGRPDPDSTASGTQVSFQAWSQDFANIHMLELETNLRGVVEQAAYSDSAGASSYSSPLITPRRRGLWSFAAARCQSGGAGITDAPPVGMVAASTSVLSGLQYGPATPSAGGAWTRGDSKQWSGFTALVS